MTTTLKLSDVLSKDEMRRLRTRSDIRASLSLAWTWGLIILAFALAIAWPGPLTILLGVLLLAGRQLALGVINHDCAHNSFFRSAALNEFVGHWICGSAMNISLPAYRAYHLRHHRYAGTPDDPDIGFVRNYPVTGDSLRRKFIRDLTGQTGIRDTIGKIRKFRWRRNWQWAAFHVLLFSILAACGAPFAYVMWWAAELFIYPAIVRLRQIGEHGTAADRTSPDARLNTGTTRAPFWQRVLVAPNDVNYHLEHHLLATVPPYNLGALHRLLSERGYYEGFDCVRSGYGDVLRRAVRPA